MIRVFSMILWLLLVPLALARRSDENPEKPQSVGQSAESQMDAIDIVKKADAATRAVKSVKYQAKVEPSPAAAGQVPVIEGTGIMAGEQQDGFDKFRFEVQVRWPGSDETSGYVIGSDRDTYYFTDARAETVYADIDPSVMGRRGRTISQLFAMAEFTHPAPFADELDGDLIKLVGTEKIGDEECHRVHVVYATGRGEAFWSFSQKDHLPRRVERILRRESAESVKYTVTVTELQVDPKLPEDSFKVVVPEGFTQTDAFAPDNP